MDQEIFYRDFELDTRRANPETRTVPASLSSETPVRRFFGIEILSHQKESIDFCRLENGSLPLLYDHDRNQIIGRAEKIRLVDGKLRAVLRFAKTEKANEWWDLIKDNILRGISIGYRIMKMEPTGQSEDGEPRFTATRWMPYECSLTPIAADMQVGINRHVPLLNTKGNKMEIVENLSDKKLEKAQRTAIFEERQRARNITAITDLYPDNREVRQAAASALSEGTSLADFQRTITPMLGSPRPLPYDRTPVSELGMSRKDVQNFSVLRAVRALVAAKLEGKSAEKIAPYEMECSLQVSQQLGRESRGFFIPLDVQRSGSWATRAAPLDSVENIHLVGTEHLAGEFIDALRSECQCINAGARVLAGLVGNVSIPRLTGSATFAWIAEGADSSDSEPTTDSVTLSPETVSGSVPITRRLTLQSSPDVEMLIRNDLILGASLALDVASLQGSGSSNVPEGIISTTGVSTSTIASAASPTWSEICEFETTLATSNALRGSLRYMVTPAIAKALKTTAKDSGSGIMLLQGGVLNDYPCVITNNLPTSGILFGNFNDLLIGIWGQVDVLPDTATLAKSGGIVLRCFLDANCAVRYPQSFCINAAP